LRSLLSHPAVLEKAGQANKKTIQIRSASQLLSLHKQGCFLDLKPEDLKHKSKAVVQVVLQHQIEQDERRRLTSRRKSARCPLSS
jgi:hypothetical protein